MDLISFFALLLCICRSFLYSQLQLLVLLNVVCIGWWVFGWSSWHWCRLLKAFSRSIVNWHVSPFPVSSPILCFWTIANVHSPQTCSILQAKNLTFHDTFQFYIHAYILVSLALCCLSRLLYLFLFSLDAFKEIIQH